ncbi:MAG: 4-(cytidine 5'-diphospho)-2-C-methyl-D-erythritol kinase [Fimbriimonadales bacterium]|nr:4-(cytidine 5'-diphospho)-2-C-methyl-D-erythritol kinase [Fimbriimonadales bacterium]MDW8051818.1 4-(cytidine 5'-diphospho)-2-C-methyl-D-erythritol kinase [Armatimonadota bacterium]
MRLEGHAPAKLNLTLEVLGRRSDGYHEVATILHTLSLYDTLVLELPNHPALASAHGSLTVVGALLPPSASASHADVPSDARNLVWKAVEAFASELALPSGEGEWRATLVKRIPAQAGLGGGSSDAATTVRLLTAWASAVGVRTPNLTALASTLGADVAFFLNGACALARGRGEQITPLPALPQFWWVLAKPYGVGVPTAWAYALLGREPLRPNTPAPYTQRLADALRQGAIRTPENLAPLLHNDFEQPVLSAIPELQTLRQQMQAYGVLRVLLCGSGAAQAGLCTSQTHAEQLAHTLTQQGYWAVAVST